MRLGTHKKRFRDLPISLRILCAFLPIGLALTAVSGLLYYTYARRVLGTLTKPKETAANRPIFHQVRSRSLMSWRTWPWPSHC